MAELMCPACTVVYTLDVIPVAMECEYCGELILPLDAERTARIRKEAEDEVEEIYRLGREHPLPPDEARALYTRIAQVIIGNSALRGGEPPFQGKTAQHVADEIMVERAKRNASQEGA